MRTRIAQKDKLRVTYKFDKESNTMDFVCDYPLGRQTCCDAGYLFSHLFTQDFKEEIERRGYDITTMKFEISPKFPTTRPDKFGTLNKKYAASDEP